MLNQNEERLQKALARAGIASRRASEELIAQGRVKVNGTIVTQLGTKINPSTDKVTVDDEPVQVRPNAGPQKIYLMLNKPQGYLSTVSDPQGRPTIMDLVEAYKGVRLFPVGRLDADTEGLLLLTNDGNFANSVSHPSFGVEKEYVALLDGIIAMKDVVKLRNGVPIPVEDPETGERDTITTKPAKVDLLRHEGSNSLVRFILKEGKKRQVRLMAEAVEHPVIELKRVRFGPVKLADLPSGKTRQLTRAEIQDLLEASRPPGEKEKTDFRQAERTPNPAGPRRSGPKPFPASGEVAEAGRSRGGNPNWRKNQPQNHSQGGERRRSGGPGNAPAERSYSGGSRTGRGNEQGQAGPPSQPVRTRRHGPPDSGRSGRSGRRG
ncbi:MAG TPA: pseudouridine synthase [Chloroflexia bacterium]|nr:pseudouridine synthase [Chloroflexia bacterium]